MFLLLLLSFISYQIFNYNIFFSFFGLQILALFCIIALNIHTTYGSLWPSFQNEQQSSQRCSGAKGLKYLSGDALTDSMDCLGPNNAPYPR